MPFQKPDYAHSGLNLIASIAGHLGVDTGHAPLKALDSLLSAKQYRNIVVILFDGLGMDALEASLPADSFLRRHVISPLSAVYPSTTTNATTTIESGLSPREHGWIGWTLYFPQIQRPVDIFTNRSNGEWAADYPVANRFIPRELIFDRITAAGLARANCVSPFGDPKVTSLDELFDAVLSLCQDDQRRYLYAYWAEPDHTMHEKGCHCAETRATVAEIDRRVEALAAALPKDTLLMVTADHGLIDGEFLYLEDHPDLRAMLRHDFSVEPRAASFHLRPECRADFPDAFRAAFGDRFLLIPGREFIADYLGDGPIRPNVYDFVGDYMALAIDRWSLDTCRGDHAMIGVHAGLTPQEMRVPLIVADN